MRRKAAGPSPAPEPAIFPWAGDAASAPELPHEMRVAPEGVASFEGLSLLKRAPAPLFSATPPAHVPRILRLSARCRLFSGGRGVAAARLACVSDVWRLRRRRGLSLPALCARSACRRISGCAPTPVSMDHAGASCAVRPDACRFRTIFSFSANSCRLICKSRKCHLNDYGRVPLDAVSRRQVKMRAVFLPVNRLFPCKARRGISANLAMLPEPVT